MMFGNKLAGKNVIVTGASGYVGGRLMERLTNVPVNIQGLDKELRFNDDRQVQINMNEKLGFGAILAQNDPEFLIHAGTNSAIQYRDNFLLAFDEDWRSINNLLNALAQADSNCRLLFFSSSYVYSAAEGEGVTEESPLDPKHNFGLAKRFFEQTLLRNHPNTVVFRLSSVFGPGHPLWPNAIEDMVRECLETGEVTVWGAGARRMQYVYIDDVVRYILHALDLEPGIYNLGSDDYIRVSDVAEIIAKCIGARVKFLKEKTEGEGVVFMETAKLKWATTDQFQPVEASLKAYIETLSHRGHAETV